MMHISELMAKAQGSIYERLMSYPISEGDIRRWVAAIYFPAEPPPEFWGDDQATTSAPHEFNPFAFMTREPRGLAPGFDSDSPDWIEDALGIPGPKLPYGLNGGIEVEYHQRMRAGDVIRSETALEAYSEKESRLGLMLLTTAVSEWVNQDDLLVKRTRMTFIRY